MVSTREVLCEKIADLEERINDGNLEGNELKEARTEIKSLKRQLVEALQNELQETSAQASTEQPSKTLVGSSQPKSDMESRFDRLETIVLKLAEHVQAIKPASDSGIQDV